MEGITSSVAVNDAVQKAISEGNAVSEITTGWEKVGAVVSMRKPLSGELRRALGEDRRLRSWSSGKTPHNRAEVGYTDDKTKVAITFPVDVKPWIEGKVSILACRACRKHTPHLTFSADTDMVTIGLTSLASVMRNEIVVTEALGPELSDKTSRMLVDRVGTELNRSDLRAVLLIRAEEAEVEAGLSFQEFRKRYRPPTLIFACPHCVTGEALVERQLSPSEFSREGGKLTIQAELEVHD